MMSPPRKIRQTRLLSWVLGLAVLIAQALGLMHGVLHRADMPSTTHLQSPASAPADRSNQLWRFTETEGASDVHDWIRALFSSHEDSSDCRLYDQASHGNVALTSVPAWLPSVMISSIIDLSRSDALARWAALFEARGPPL
jgi:hypothetical protein